MKLSVCFTVYNQIDILKRNLDYINYENLSDVEIIITDDNSEDDIEGLVKSYNNEKFKYYKTPYKLGHDLNILFGIEHASSDYVMILRTRDCLKCENISHIMECINHNPDVGYYLFSAEYNEKVRLSFYSRRYKKGKETMKASFLLPSHPSGNIYNKKYLNIELYKKYINHFFDNIYGFSVHELMRYDLSWKSDFLTSEIVGWIYADTLKASDKAVNASGNGKNIYAPSYCYPRYKCQFTFLKKNAPKKNKLDYLKLELCKQYSFIIGKSKTIICDRRYNFHYSSRKESINRRRIAEKLDIITEELISDLENELKNELIILAKRQRNLTLYLYPIKEFVRNVIVGTDLYDLYRSLLNKKVINIKD